MRASVAIFTFLIFQVSIINAGFLDTVSSFLSGSSSSTVSPDSLLSKLQNSSLGQAVATGIETYNEYKNSSSGNDTASSLLAAAQNSSIGIAIANYLGGNNTLNLGNSSFGDLVLNGINTLINGNSSQSQLFLANYVPFLANASANATAAFTALLPQISNLSIADYEVAMSNWAATWNLTDAYNAHVAQLENRTAQAEANASRIVLSLDLVLTNIKSIQNNKNQTMTQLVNATLTYLNTLDDDTRAVVFVLYRSVLPPALQSIGTCAVSSGGLSNLFQRAGNFLSGSSNSTSILGLNSNIFQNFFNRNNSTITDFSSSVQSVLGDTASVQVAVVDSTTKKTKTTKKKTTKKNKKTTTVAPSRK